jgi:hypothetical protein
MSEHSAAGSLYPQREWRVLPSGMRAPTSTFKTGRASGPTKAERTWLDYYR